MQWLILILILPYLFLILRIFEGLKKLRPYSLGNSRPDFISVIVACRNEEENIPALVGCLKNQDYEASRFEVILVDDNSTDLTYSVATGFSDFEALRVIRNTGKGKKAALAAGIIEARGNIIVTTDADCRPGNNWLGTIASYFAERSPDMLICPVMTESQNGFLNRLQETEFLSLQAVTAGTAGNNSPVMCNGANLAFTKDAYFRNSENLHPEILTGDDIFLLHSLAANRSSRIEWIESYDTLIFTSPEKTLRGFLAQRARWISKAGAYRNVHTIILGIVTFVTILVQAGLFIAGITDADFLKVFAVFFVLKSIPDLLVTANRAIAYGKEKLLWYFLPAQFLYPFYVIAVTLTALFTGKKYRTN